MSLNLDCLLFCCLFWFYFILYFFCTAAFKKKQHFTVELNIKYLSVQPTVCFQSFSTMDKGKELLCQNLDKLVIDFFDALDILYQKQAKMEQHMRDGYLSLSRARYTMGGTRNVGMLQFAENGLEMQALKEVEILDFDHEDSDEETKHGQKNLTAIEMTLINRRVQKDKSEENDDSKSSGETVRRRNINKDCGGSEPQEQTKGIKSSSDSVESSISKDKDKNNANEEKGCKKAGPKDPIHLFGYLVSPHLRHSQACFEQATEISVEIANLKNKLSCIKKEYKALLEEKHEFFSS